MQKTMIMVIDITDKLEIKKYFKRQNLSYKENLYDDVAGDKCLKNNCSHIHELILMKEIKRDEDLYFEIEMEKTKNEVIVVDGGYLYDLYKIKKVNVKKYKEYMREFKKRKHSWQFKAIIFRPEKTKSLDYTDKFNEIIKVIEQSQIDYAIVNQEKSLFVARKDVYKKVVEEKNNVTNCNESGDDIE
jgi:endonuclease IV